MKSISQCRKERCDRLRSRVLEMSHEDRLKLASRKRAHGVGEFYSDYNLCKELSCSVVLTSYLL